MTQETQDIGAGSALKSVGLAAQAQELKDDGPGRNKG